MKVTQHAMPLTWIIHFDFVFRNKGEKNEEGKGNNFFFKSLAFGVTPLIDKKMNQQTYILMYNAP